MAETLRTPVFTRYEVLHKIGSGSMGAVYKARDLRLDRWVALKVLPPGVRTDPEALERFKREARTLAQLKHSGVASVYDTDVEGDFPYLVMEFVEGPNLETLLQQRGPLPISEVVRIGQEVAEALAHIHSHRIIHRDIKASNLIIGPAGRAVVTDFGVAYVASLPRISQGMLGTPEYMSPEQADGRPTDGRSDLYSVGVVLYECLAGQLPFQRANDSFAALNGLLQQVMTATPAPLRTHRRDVPTWLAEVVMRCLAKKPEDRFTQASALVAALQQGAVPAAAGAAVATARTALKPPPPDPSAPREPVPAPAAPVVVISHTEAIEAVAFSPRGRRLATACKDQTVRLWTVPDGGLQNTLRGPGTQAVAFSPRGHMLATGDVDGMLRLWDTRSGESLRTLEAHAGYVLAVAYSRDGQQLASGGTDGAVRLWDTHSGRLIRTLGRHTGYVLSLAFSPDGQQLASGGADGAVRLWDTHTGSVTQVLKGHAGYVPSVAFSPDGHRLASGGVDGAIRLWDVHAARLERRLDGHTDWVMSVAFSPDGVHLASASRDRSVRLWNVRQGTPLRRLDGHTGPVMSLAFSPDGRRLASGSSDRTVRLWTLRPRDLMRRLSRRGVALLATLAMLAGLLYGHQRYPEVAPATADAVIQWPAWDTAWTTLTTAYDDAFATVEPPSATPKQVPQQPARPQRAVAQPAAAQPAPAPPRRTNTAQHNTPQQAATHPPADQPGRAATTQLDEAGEHLTAGPSDPSLSDTRWGEEEAFHTEAGASHTAQPSLRDPALYGTAPIDAEAGGYTLGIALVYRRTAAEYIADGFRARGFRVGIFRDGFNGRVRYRVGVGQFDDPGRALALRRALAGRALPLDTFFMQIRAEGHD